MEKLYFNNAEPNTVKFKNIKFDNSDYYTIMEANRNYLEKQILIYRFF